MIKSSPAGTPSPRRALRRRILVAGIVLLAAGLGLALANCGRKPIPVGVSLTLTGFTSQIGVTGRNGIELAAEAINASGGVKGRPIKLLVRDDGDDPDKAVAADAELLAEGAVAIVGHMSSRSGLKAVPFLNEKEVVFVSPTISSTDWSGRDDYFFRPIGPNDLQGKALAARARELGLSRAAALYESTNRAYTYKVYESFAESFTAAGGAVEAPLTFSIAEENDYADLARRLLRGRPDCILSVAGPMENARLCQELAKLGSDLPVFAGMWSMNADLIANGGETVGRMRVAGVMDLEDRREAFAAFREAYVARFRQEPAFASMFGYESLMLLAEGMRRANGLSGDAIKKAILGLRNFEGLQGPLEIDAYGDCRRPYRVFAVRGERFVPDQG